MIPDDDDDDDDSWMSLQPCQHGSVETACAQTQQCTDTAVRDLSTVGSPFVPPCR